MAEGRCINKHLPIFLFSSILAGCLSLEPADAQGPYTVNMNVIRNAVVFLHIKDGKTGELSEVGTGFLLQVPLRSDPKLGYWLIVTARHMVDPDWAGCHPDKAQIVAAVFNKKDFNPVTDREGTVEAKISDASTHDAWKYPPDDSVDIAVALLDGQRFSQLAAENSPISFSQLPTQSELEAVDTGAPNVSAGLLMGVSGNRRNYPIFKSGNVSSKPQEKITMICCPDCPAVPQTEWVIAASLVSGNSGSPIVYAPPLIASSGNRQRAFLLGVQSSALVGDDVAGMAPASYLIEVIQRMNLRDADLSPAVPNSSRNAATSAAPATVGIPGPTKQQK